MIRGTLLLLAASGCGFGTIPLVKLPASLPTTTIRAAAADAAGNVYVTGAAYQGPDGKSHFPASAGAFQTVYGSHECVRPSLSLGLFCTDAFVAKFNPAGELVYATYLGGSGNEEGFAIAVDRAGDAWVTGYTTSNDFPITANALQKKNAGGTRFISATTPPPFEGDVFIAGLNSAGSALLYSSFLGGSGADAAYGLSMDAQGALHLAGQTLSVDFPVTTAAPAPATTSKARGFVAKFNPAGPAMAYCINFEAPIQAMALDPAGSVYVTGSVDSDSGFSTTSGAFQTTFGGLSSAFVTKLSSDGAKRIYSTLLGGTFSSGSGIGIDAAGTAWVVGKAGIAFPVTAPPASQNGDAFVFRLNADGSTLLFSRIIVGGSSADQVLLDSSDNAYVSGTAYAPDFVRTSDALENTACEVYPSFIMKWSPQGALLYSSLSREGPALAIDSSDKLYLLEPTANLVRYDPYADQRQSALACMTNAGSFNFSRVAPGEIVSLFGDRLGPTQAANWKLDESGRVGTTLAGMRVLFDGAPAPLLYADQNQINAIVPWGLKPGTTSTVTVEYAGVDSPSLTVPVVSADPGVFRMYSAKSPMQGAVLNEDGSVNSAENPARLGSIISIFGTGMGLLNPLPQDGEIITDAAHLVQLAVHVIFSGLQEADVTYAGAAPTLPAGVIQINVRLPESCQPTVLVDACPIFIKMNDLLSGFLATVAVK